MLQRQDRLFKIVPEHCRNAKCIIVYDWVMWFVLQRFSIVWNVLEGL